MTPRTVAHQAPLSMGFPRQEYWSGLPFTSPGDLPSPRIYPTSPALAGRFFITELLGKPPGHILITLILLIIVCLLTVKDLHLSVIETTFTSFPKVSNHYNTHSKFKILLFKYRELQSPKSFFLNNQIRVTFSI